VLRAVKTIRIPDFIEFFGLGLTDRQIAIYSRLHRLSSNPEAAWEH
jgi:hypothetical protein